MKEDLLGKFSAKAKGSTRSVVGPEHGEGLREDAGLESLFSELELGFFAKVQERSTGSLELDGDEDLVPQRLDTEAASLKRATTAIAQVYQEAGGDHPR